VRAGDRAVLARAITLVESTRPDDEALALALIDALQPFAGGARRVGISGAPGVGKSSFIEALGTRLSARGHALAVLAVDPSSARAGGSILGDKTRMAELARDPRAFIRPSPAGRSLGGVARHTRETITLCEAAGFDVVIVETVGVGQSEVVVAGMVDTFVLLLQPGGGDELQGIKRGIMEHADVLIVTKADGPSSAAAALAAREYAAALQLVPPRRPGWSPPVLTCSAHSGAGLDAAWAAIARHGDALAANGQRADARGEQQVTAMWRAIEAGLIAAFRRDPSVAAAIAAIEPRVLQGRLSPERAAQQLVGQYVGARPPVGTGRDDPT
jgi:LAO/AO transport system kinase